MDAMLLFVGGGCELETSYFVDITPLFQHNSYESHVYCVMYQYFVPFHGK